MQNVIKITDVSKAFVSCGWPWQKKRVTHALSGINLEVKEGVSLGLLGPNGAGKTTLLKILSTIILADSGKVTIAGLRPDKEASKIKSIIGLTVPEERSFYWRLTGRQNLEFFACLYGLSKVQAKSRIDELFRLFGINFADRRFDSYSAGMKRKLVLARTLLHNPQILLLDEPTKSLDYNSASELKNLIKKLFMEGKTIIFATHNIEEVQQLCNTFIILNQGKICASGSLQELRDKTNSPGGSLAEIYLKLTQNA